MGHFQPLRPPPPPGSLSNSLVRIPWAAVHLLPHFQGVGACGLLCRAGPGRAGLCCVLCRAVLCCAVLCCAVLCCPALLFICSFVVLLQRGLDRWVPKAGAQGHVGFDLQHQFPPRRLPHGARLVVDAPTSVSSDPGPHQSESDAPQGYAAPDSTRECPCAQRIGGAAVGGSGHASEGAAPGWGVGGAVRKMAPRVRWRPRRVGQSFPLFPPFFVHEKAGVMQRGLERE